jgi:general stress protein YciG
MAGTRTGGLKAAAKNRAKDPDFYNKMGRRGGEASVAAQKANGRKLGFADMPREKVQAAGSKGGRLGRRT